MAKLEVADGLRRARTQGYEHAVVSWVDDDGYPMSVAGPFVAQESAGSLDVGPLGAHPPSGSDMCVIVSHIRPRPGVGYDERRYVTLWGAARTTEDGTVTLAASSAAGWDEQDTPFVEYAERSVGRGLSYLDAHDAKPRVTPAQRFFLATRVPFLTATLVPLGLAAAVAAHDGRMHWGWWLLALLSAVTAHLGLNVANDLADDTSGADAANMSPTMFSGGSRVIQYRLITRRGMVALCLGLYAVSAASGFVLAASRSWWLLVVGAIAVVLSVEYTAPPLRLVHRGLGEPVVAFGFGPIMAVGAYVAVTMRWSWEMFYVSLPVGILIALVLYINQIPDQRGDAAIGKRTVIVRWPRRTVLHAYAAGVATAQAMIVAGVLGGLTPGWTLLSLLGVPLAVITYRGARAHYEQPYALSTAMAANIGLHAITGVLLIVGYVIA